MNGSLTVVSVRKSGRARKCGGDPIVLLIPARTDTTYFHDYIYGKYGKAEIRFVRGRLRFTDDDGNAADPAPFTSMVVIYKGKKKDWAIRGKGIYISKTLW